MSLKQNVHELLALPENEQRSGGYFHTLREILQQPATWMDTCDRVSASAGMLEGVANGIQSLVLTGSGSSQFAGECVRLVLQKELGVTADAIGGGARILGRFLRRERRSVLELGRPLQGRQR